MNEEKMSLKRALLLLAAVIFTAIVGYAFLFGPLFPFSPIKIRFASEKLSRGIVFYPRNTALASEYYLLDGLMAETEEFHNLRFKKKIKVIVCATDAQHKRISMTGGRTSAARTGTVIYVSPSIKEAEYPPATIRARRTPNRTRPATG